ncbi:MAG: flagellar hook-associated protein FlgL [Candidatus Hatepunaea meridiana]|nr:flagellar hook-associated protein FlgL [Candidatus Hatepunaea meridiana]
MRISQSIITRTLLQSLNRNRENLNEFHTAIATGREVRQSSDDPVQFARASRFRNNIDQNEQYLRNITDAKGWLDTTSAILESFHSIVLKAKEIATQGADESYNTDNRTTMANQINEIIKEVISLSNSSYLDKSIFAGTATKSENESFDYDGASVTYNGNANSITRRIAENQRATINISGEQLMDSEMFSALINLRDALNGNNTEGVRNSIDALDSASKNLLALSSGMGSVKNRITMVEQRLETANINLSSYLSQSVDADLAEYITKYNTEEMAYHAALQTTSNALQLNLLDFLR